ncbi:MAG: MFS transporter [Candidatus Pacearchaeota archaeon]
MNKKLFLLILSDVLILSSFGLIGPIFAIFITNNLEGGGLVSAGLATTIFLVVKSVVQLPLSRFFIDKEKHKTHSLLLGTLLIITVPFIYLSAKHVNIIFLAQIIYGLGAAMAYPAWFTLFTNYLDKKHKGFEYTLWATGVGIGGALSAYLGAKLADLFGFQILFFIVGIVAFIGFFLLIILDRIEIKNVNKRGY